MSKTKSDSKEITAEEKAIISSEQKIYEYDEAYQEKYLKAKPWDKDDTHFKKSLHKYFSCHENYRSCN